MKFSIIITTYNSSSHIEPLLDSIQNQEGLGKDFEIETIVIDDQSTDNTWTILEKYDIIRFRNERNSGGPNRGRNKGLEIATGDYICIVDHDDIWDEHRLSALLPYLNKAKIISSGYRLAIGDEIKEVVSKNANGYIYFEPNKSFLDNLIRSKNAQKIYLGSLAFDSSLKHNLFEEEYGVVDYDWKFRMLENNDSIEICKTLYLRNVEKSNLSLNESYRKKDYEYSLTYLNSIESKYPKHVAIAINKVNGTMGKYYYRMNKNKKARSFFAKAEQSLSIKLYMLTSYFCSPLVSKLMKW